ncbi:ABC transporter permease [Blastococcus xanthinilyticus]|uniref:Peptide/nickel transport system permease protein n=1 Tax=Blastococcus xanthinilyticus TaxID=1564164 RepID=A0A5S5D457_9ACTN|nr:ABC transporter permease [Blastococcus xanthinilyticus]TYP89592.1 peptide/nickel transport system permease protein [Blastococcus xanthinilyticus]
MAGLVLRRIRDLVIVLFLVGTAMFFIIHLIPGNPAIALLGPYATQEQIADLTASLGLDQPLFTQYVTWLGNLVQGDMGSSLIFAQPVLPVILDHVTPTILLALGSTIISAVIAVPLAIHAAAKPRSLWARMVTPVTAFGLAMPSFWLALVLVLVFGVIFQVLPTSGYVDFGSDPGEAVKYLVLPIVVLVAHQAALFVATLRESMSGELLSLYLRSARAKGVRERGVLYRHALPNALLPAITVIGSSFGNVLGGVVVIETVFSIPGWGQLLYNGITSRDYQLIIGVTLMIAVVYVVVNLIADLLYLVADPRVRVR